MSTDAGRYAAPPQVAASGGRTRIRTRPSMARPASLRRRPGRDTTTPVVSSTGSPPAAGPFEWHQLPEPQRVLAYTELRSWVTWLAGRYRLTIEDRLPPCWSKHPELIEELTALHAWRTYAYGPEGTGQAAVYWHQALITFLANTATWWSAGCRAGHKHAPEPTPTPWTPDDVLAGLATETINPLISNSTENGEPAMPTLNVITDQQMRTLISANLAHPLNDTWVEFVYYDRSWWVRASNPTPLHSDQPPNRDGVIWLRADDDDLAADPTFRTTSRAA
jgi:hypothetical protein